MGRVGVRFGNVWRSLVRQSGLGKTRFGQVRSGAAQFGKAGKEWLGEDR